MNLSELLICLRLDGGFAEQINEFNLKPICGNNTKHTHINSAMNLCASTNFF